MAAKNITYLHSSERPPWAIGSTLPESSTLLTETISPDSMRSMESMKSMETMKSPGLLDKTRSSADDGKDKDYDKEY